MNKELRTAGDRHDRQPVDSAIAIGFGVAAFVMIAAGGFVIATLFRFGRTSWWRAITPDLFVASAIVSVWVVGWTLLRLRRRER